MEPLESGPTKSLIYHLKLEAELAAGSVATDDGVITIIRSDGKVEDVEAVNIKSVTKTITGSGKGTLEVIVLPVFTDFGYENITIICDDEGVHKQLEVNDKATKLYRFGRGVFGDITIRGPVAIFSLVEFSTGLTSIARAAAKISKKMLVQLLELTEQPKAISQVKRLHAPITISPQDEILLKLMCTLKLN